MKKIAQFYAKIVTVDSKISSKRVIAVWFSFIVSVIAIVGLFKDISANMLLIVYSLLGAIGTLLGIAANQANKIVNRNSIFPSGTPPKEKDKDNN